MLTRISRRVALPHEPGAWVEIKALSWRQLKRARDARLVEAISQYKAMAGMLDSLPSASRETAAETDQLDSYELGQLLADGIVAWSYDDEVTPDAIDALDEETARFLGHEILRPALPSEEERTERFLHSI